MKKIQKLKTQKVHVPTTPFVTEVEVNFFTESYGTLSTQGRYLVKLIEYTVKFSISFSKSKAIRSVQVTKNGGCTLVSNTFQNVVLFKTKQSKVLI